MSTFHFREDTVTPAFLLGTRQQLFGCVSSCQILTAQDPSYRLPNADRHCLETLMKPTHRKCDHCTSLRSLTGLLAQDRGNEGIEGLAMPGTVGLPFLAKGTKLP